MLTMTTIFRASRLLRSGPLAFAAMAGAALVPASASAQAAASGRVFVDLDRWTIYSRDGSRSCTLRSTGSNPVQVVMTKTANQPAVLLIELPQPSVFIGDITFTFDEAEFAGRQLGRQSFTPLEANMAIESAFREARNLSLLQGGATIASISLQYSSAGLRLLKQCAEIGRMGIAPAPEPQPSAPPTEPGPARGAPSAARTPPPSPPPSLARPAAPIDPGNWVGNTDRLRFPSSGWAGGILRFTLSVDQRGRAEECVVDRSTGARDLDQQLCRRLIRRARFEPARDASGNPTRGSFTSSLRLNIPD